MRHDWIIDVLTDLQAFADMNDLGPLAGRLSETADFARDTLRTAADPDHRPDLDKADPVIC